MKRAFAILATILLLFSVSFAEGIEKDFPFHIKESDTYDEVVKKIVDLFGEGKEETDQNRMGDYVIRPDAKLYGMDIVGIGISKEFAFNESVLYSWELTIELDNADNSAEDIISVYDYLVFANGKPLGMNPILYDYDFNGSRHLYNLMNENEELQHVIDIARAGEYKRKSGETTFDSFFYDLYWRDCGLRIYVSKYSSTIRVIWTNYAAGAKSRYQMYKISE